MRQTKYDPEELALIMIWLLGRKLNMEIDKEIASAVQINSVRGSNISIFCRREQKLTQIRIAEILKNLKDWFCYQHLTSITPQTCS